LVGFSVLYTKEDFLVLGLVNILRKLKIIGSNFAKFSVSKKKKREKRKEKKERN
jgi:hypothetical protein